MKEKQAAAVDKSKLEEKIKEAQARLEQKEDYTLNSVQKLEEALAAAQAVVKNESAGQTMVDQTRDELEEAIQGLKKVQGVTTLVLPVKQSSGQAAPVNTEFVRRHLKYGVNHRIFVNGDGNLVWEPGIYDEGDFEFYLPEGSAYLSSPGRIKVHVGMEDGTPVIETIAGKPASGAKAEFNLSEKRTDSCDLTHFRAVVQDKNGKLLSGITFSVENGDPLEITSDENGVITYEATMWDTDTTMKVKLKDGQGYSCKDQAEFSVIADPTDEDQAILGTVNGKPFQGGEKIVFQLSKDGETQTDWSGLEAAMNRAGKLDPNRYTEDSYAKVTEKLEAARKIYGTVDASQSAIDQAAKELNTAIDNLKEKPAAPEYQVTKGEGQSVVVGKDARFVTNGKADKFETVLVDQKELKADQYTVSGETLTVTLKSSYLSGLKAGTHTIEIVFTDGSVQTQFTVQADEQGGGSQNPQEPQDPQGGSQGTDEAAGKKEPSGQKAESGEGVNQAAKTQDTNAPLLWTALGAGALAMIVGIRRRTRK